MSPLTIFTLSLKNLLARRTRSVLITLAIAIGVGAVVFLVALGYGLEDLTIRGVADLDTMRVFDVNPGSSELLRVDKRLEEIIGNEDHVMAVEPLYNTPGNVELADSSAEAVIFGTTAGYFNITQTSLELGRFFSDEASDEVLISKNLLSAFSLDEKSALGKEIKINFVLEPDENVSADGKGLESHLAMKIVGVINNSPTKAVYLPIDKLRKMGIDRANLLKVEVDDQNNLGAIRKKIENLGYSTSYVGDTIKQVESFFKVFRVALALVGSIAVLIATLGMFNILTISLLERTRQVALMKVLGMRGRTVRLLFLADTIIIGFLGSVLGIILAAGLGELINGILAKIASSTGNPAVRLFIFPWRFILVVFIAGILLSVLTGFYPALRAQKTEPLEALRYE